MKECNVHEIATCDAGHSVVCFELSRQQVRQLRTKGVAALGHFRWKWCTNESDTVVLSSKLVRLGLEQCTIRCKVLSGSRRHDVQEEIDHNLSVESNRLTTFLA